MVHAIFELHAAHSSVKEVDRVCEESISAHLDMFEQSSANAISINETFSETSCASKLTLRNSLSAFTTQCFVKKFSLRMVEKMTTDKKLMKDSFIYFDAKIGVETHSKLSAITLSGGFMGRRHHFRSQWTDRIKYSERDETVVITSTAELYDSYIKCHSLYNSNRFLQALFNSYMYFERFMVSFRANEYVTITKQLYSTHMVHFQQTTLYQHAWEKSFAAYIEFRAHLERRYHSKGVHESESTSDRFTLRLRRIEEQVTALKQLPRFCFSADFIPTLPFQRPMYC